MKDGNSIQAVVQPPQALAAGAQHLLEAQELQVSFPVGSAGFGKRRLQLKAVQGVSFGLNAGETVGLVGESGCGKSTLGRALAGLVKPTGGRILFQGNDLAKQGPAEWRAFRREVQIVFQDSQGALSPRLSVEELIGEGLDIHRLAKDSGDRLKQVLQLLEAVGLDGDLARRYPHQLSGGQRQRVGLARALAVQPKLLILDEPLSALDVSVQAQIVNLLQRLRDQRGLTFLLIAHDLAVVEHLSQRILVMYLGKIVEQAEARTLTGKPLHPYTQALLSAVPVLEPVSGHKRIILAGEPPSPLHPPSGCPFHTRCPVAELPRCQREAPAVREVAPGHWVACHLA